MVPGAKKNAAVGIPIWLNVAAKEERFRLLPPVPGITLRHSGFYGSSSLKVSTEGLPATWEWTTSNKRLSQLSWDVMANVPVESCLDWDILADSEAAVASTALLLRG